MKTETDTPAGKVRIGTVIRIKRLDDPFSKSYVGREGTVTCIDDMNQLHGTWGGLAIIPEEDQFEIVN